MLDQSYYVKTDEIIEHYGRKPASLIPIMQDIQAEYRYLPGELLTYVASKIGVTEAKFFHKGFLDRHGFTYMTGSSVADLDHILTLRLKGKVLIKGGNTVSLCLSNPDLRCHIGQKLSRQVTVFRLNILHDRNQ